MKNFKLYGSPNRLKYFWAENEVDLKAICPKCKKEVIYTMQEFPFPEEQEEIDFFCESCDKEFYKKVKCVSAKAEFIFEIGEEVEIDESGK